MTYPASFTPGPNSKTISVLGKSKSKSYLASQYWANLNTSLKSLASFNQDLDNTWKLIPKSKPTFQKFRVKFLNSKKFRNVPRFLHYFVCTLSVPLKTDANWCQLMPGDPGRSNGTKLVRFQVFLSRFQPFLSHFEPNFSRKSTYIFQILKCLVNRIEEKL